MLDLFYKYRSSQIFFFIHLSLFIQGNDKMVIVMITLCVMELLNIYDDDDC